MPESRFARGFNSLGGYHRETKESDYQLPVVWFLTLVGAALKSLLIVLVSAVLLGPRVGVGVMLAGGVMLVLAVAATSYDVPVNTSMPLVLLVTGAVWSFLAHHGAWPNLSWGCLGFSSVCWTQRSGAFVGRSMAGWLTLLRIAIAIGLPAAWFGPLRYVWFRGIREIAWPGLNDFQAKPVEVDPRHLDAFSDGRFWVFDEKDTSPPQMPRQMPKHTVDVLTPTNGDTLAGHNERSQVELTVDQWLALREHARRGLSFSGDVLAEHHDAFTAGPNGMARKVRAAIPDSLLERGPNGQLYATAEFRRYLDGNHAAWQQAWSDWQRECDE
jgi:hypothetical protein